ncbi:MAG: insulinase family protein [Gemmatimonadetes bacterium]|nr:insulinase family protein [Gemmatimonadota bacterium]
MAPASRWLVFGIAALVASCTPSSATAQISAATASRTPALADSFPIDPAIIRGTLPNGLRYFIRQNGKPEKRAELRLIIRAGSILEDDDQRGLAHYVEHMAFNGTWRFPKQDIVAFLERSGMRFGADLNAYTSFDETVYQLQIPTDTLALLNTALDVLQDWASAVTFDSTEFERERGVVVEEWRLGRGARQRIADRQFAEQFRGSRYAERQPVGTKESLDRATLAAARRFYHEWYRPDLMAVVAVGDFDTKAMEQAIRARFGSLRNPATPRPRPTFDAPDYSDGTRAVIAADPEFPQSIAQVNWLLPPSPRGTVGTWRTNVVSRIYNALIGQRFGELSQRESTPFAFAFAGFGSLIPTRDAFTAAAVVKESRFTDALTATLAELERANRFGFTATEFERQKTSLMRSFERAVAEASKTESRMYAEQLASHFLRQGNVASADQVLQLATALLPGITLDEVNAAARDWMPERNRLVAVAAPARADITLPTDSALRAVFGGVKRQALTAYVDSAANQPLVASPPAPGRVAKTSAIADLGIAEWTLSNGVRVLLKPTDFKNDQVLLSGRRPGGFSVFSNVDHRTATLSELVLGGAGTFSENQLRRMLTGKVARAGVSVSEHGESALGSASPRDLETMFQLFWLQSTAPRLDTALFNANRAMIKAEMQNARNTPEQAFGDTIDLVMANYHPRVRLFQPEQLDSLDVLRAYALYRQRFASFNGFTFYLVGNFTLEGIRPLVERYLGGLPKGGPTEAFVDRGIRPPPGVVTRVVRKGQDPKAQTRITFHGAFDYSWENRLVLDALQQLLDMRLRDAMREERGGTYGVSVSAIGSWIPFQRYAVSLGFGSAPDRVEELVQTAFAVMDSVKRTGPTADELTKIRETFIRVHETGLRENAAWLRWMSDHDEDGRDQHVTVQYPALVQALTAEQLRDAARRYLTMEQYARFTLLPEAPAKPAP